MKRVNLFLIVAAVMSLVALSCKKVDVGDDDFVAVSKVSLNHSNETLTLGGTLQLVATVEPANASKKTVKWSTSSSDIASVSSEGLVSASKIGNATITAEAGGVSATCKINVVAEAIPVTGVSISPSNPEVGVGKTIALTANLTPSNATNHNVSWESLSPNIASIDAKGVVTGKSRGTAAIKVTTADGGKTATVNLKVLQPYTSLSITSPNRTDFSVDNNCIVLTTGKTYKISVTPTPATADDALVYEVPGGVSSTYVSVTEDGKLTALKYSNNASVTVTVKAKYGTASASFDVKVFDPISSYTLYKRKSQCIAPGKTQKFFVDVEPKSAYYKGTLGVQEVSNNSLTATISNLSSGDHAAELTVKLASSLSDSQLSTAGSTKQANVTLYGGPKQGNKVGNILFIFTKFDPEQVKPGDLISIRGGNMICHDGGNRGLGYFESNMAVKDGKYDVAVIAYVGNQHISDDPILPTLLGPDYYYDNEWNKTSISNAHGIAIPINASDIYRLTAVSDWAANANGEKWMENSSGGDVKNITPYDVSLIRPVSPTKHTAYHNTAALLKFSNDGQRKYDVCPILYFSSDKMKSVIGASSLRYANYYYDGKNASANINKTCPYLSSPGDHAAYWVGKSRCTPWLLPTVKDLMTIFADSYQVNLLNKVTGWSYNMVYWTGQDGSTTQAWGVSVTWSGATSGLYGKSTTHAILPIFYF